MNIADFVIVEFVHRIPPGGYQQEQHDAEQGHASRDERNHDASATPGGWQHPAAAHQRPATSLSRALWFHAAIRFLLLFYIGRQFVQPGFDLSHPGVEGMAVFVVLALFGHDFFVSARALGVVVVVVFGLLPIFL
jgi:hypothetical protein